MNWLENLFRPEVLKMKGYPAQRDENAHQIWLDANECCEEPYGEKGCKYNRYPEQQQTALRERLGELYGVKPEQLLITRGADEGIDALIAAFCRPLKDSITVTPPTFVCYEMAAAVRCANVNKIPLDNDFNPNWEALKIVDNSKLIFICTPNNPTGNKQPIEKIEELCKAHHEKSIIVVDEAYIEFSDAMSAITLLDKYDNVIILRTLSKAHALAGLRIGAIISSPFILHNIWKIMQVFPIPRPSTVAALKYLTPVAIEKTKERIERIKIEREYLSRHLPKSPYFTKVYSTDSNFFFIIAKDAVKLCSELESKDIFIKNMSFSVDSAVRISIGTKEENRKLLAALGVNDI